MADSPTFMGGVCRKMPVGLQRASLCSSVLSRTDCMISVTQCKMKMQGPCSRSIRNSKSVRKHSTKHRALRSVGHWARTKDLTKRRHVLQASQSMEFDAETEEWVQKVSFSEGGEGLSVSQMSYNWHQQRKQGSNGLPESKSQSFGKFPG